LRAPSDQYGDRLWTRVIPVDTQFREASRAGVPLNVYNPQARGARAYGSLLRWLLAPAPAEMVEAPAPGRPSTPAARR